MTELELLDRECRATERRIRQAKFPVIKTMDSFDFLAIPSLNKTLVLELARCEFLARRENILLLGNRGTGKTHIALALGVAACQHGHRPRFATTAALVSELIEAPGSHHNNSTSLFHCVIGFGFLLLAARRAVLRKLIGTLVVPVLTRSAKHSPIAGANLNP